MFYVYVLQNSVNQHLYVGFTENVDRRLASHNLGDVISTKAYRPWKRIFYECYINKMDALRREKYLKTTAGKHGLKLMLRETLHVDINSISSD